MSEKKSNITIYLIIAIGIAAGFFFLGKCTKKDMTENEKTNFISALQDSLQYYKGSDSVNKWQISVLMTHDADHFINLQIKDSTIQKLQAEVKKYKDQFVPGSAVVKGRTALFVKSATRSDSVRVGSNMYYKRSDGVWVMIRDVESPDTIPYVENGLWQTPEKPVYFYSDSTQWFQYNAVAQPDSLSFSLRVHNEFTGAILYDKKEKKPYMQLTLKNPYSEVKEMRVYAQSYPEPKVKRWGIGLQAGGTYILDKWRPYVGVGLSYNVIRF